MPTVSTLMTRDVRCLTPDDSVVLAAQTMAALDVGVIPICDGERLIGIVTDRDIVLRGVAAERPLAQTPLRDIMSAQVRCAHIDDPVEQVLDAMTQAKVRRMPVVDAEEHLVGVVGLGDLAVRHDERAAAESFAKISVPVQARQAGGGG
jgi:CBS domain-containing protein